MASVTVTTANATTGPTGCAGLLPVTAQWAASRVEKELAALEAENAKTEASLKFKWEAKAADACDLGPEAAKALLEEEALPLEAHVEPGLLALLRKAAASSTVPASLGSMAREVDDASLSTGVTATSVLVS